MADDERPLTPASRQRHAAIVGTPLDLCGATWYLAPGGLHPALDELRDELYDRACLSGGFRLNRTVPGVADDYYAAADVAAYLLRLHYDLTDIEAAALVTRGCEPVALYAAVHEALFGTARPRRTYTEWARGSLFAAGIDPHSVPPGDVPLVLELLVRAGRAAPAQQFVSAQQAAPHLDIWRALAHTRAPAPEAR